VAYLFLVRRMRAAVVLVVLLWSATCYAGAKRTFACRNCGLEGQYVHGALLTADQIVAFCSNGNHIVNISWDYKKRAPKPAKFDHGVPIYVCPTCDTPTARLWDENNCPRCGSKNIKIRDTGLMVD